MVPTAGLSDQVTAVLADPFIVALNCFVPPLPRLTAAGVMATETVDGASFTTAVANLVGSAADVAVMTKVKGAVTEAGAV